MGQEFGDDGKLVKYSNLFDYSSLATLQASLWLPTPKGVQITSDQEKDGYDISSVLAQLQPIIDSEDSADKAVKIRTLAELIIDLYDYMDRSKVDSINLRYADNLAEVAEKVKQELIKHERTSISANLEESAYKNSISANIKNIVQDLRNMDLAYSPISMSDLQTLAAESEKGALVASMSLMNPLTKYSMQVQNMVGKKVIGIAAVGEKVFFNLSYYYNEGVRSGDERWIKNLQFSQTFDRIQGRYNAKKGRGQLESITKTSLANVNFQDVDAVRAKFLSAAQVDSQLRKEFNITDYDVESQSANWQLYAAKLRNILEQRDSGQVGDELIETSKRVNRTQPVDLMISQILSAATDNAKELILAKINAGDNLAKVHLYLIMLGFDIKDVVTFMTSPCVSMINDLSEANMMDSYVSELRIEDAMNLVEGIIDPSKFLFGSISAQDEYGSYNEVSRVESVFGYFTNTKLYNILLERLRAKSDAKNPKFTFPTFILEYILARMDGVDLQPLDSYVRVSDYESRKGLLRMSDYVERLIYSTQKARAKYTDIADFDKDLAEFKKVYKLANETTTLGGVFLGMNQGLPGSKVDLQDKLRKIGQTITTREDEFGIGGVQSFILNPEDKEQTNRDKNNKFEVLCQALIDNNEFIKDDVVSTLKAAVAFDVVRNFNIEDWLYNRTLTAEDIKNDTFMGTEVTAEEVLGGKDSMSYRELIANYYNIIKGTWNIFDMMNRIPQYAAIIDLLKSTYVIDKHTSIKSALTNKIYDEVYKTSGFIDEKQNKAIIKYVDDLLITSFFRDNNFSFPVLEGMDFLDSSYKTRTAQSNRTVDLNNAPGRASFKMVFEAAIQELKNKGTYGNVTIPNYKDNAFLQGLRIVYDKNEVPSLTLELDMMKINSTPNSQRVFQEYLNGLNALKDIKINGVSVADWFILYNLYTNLNQYGSDRLTTIFKNMVVNKGSILEEYFKFIGNLDYNKVGDDTLELLEYNREDLLIRLAPYVSRSEESRSRVPYIRTRNAAGEIVYKKYNSRTKTYKEISTFPNKDLLAEDDSNVTEEQKSNYQSYLTMPMKNQDFNVSLREGLMSSDLDTLIDVLLIYSKKGLLQIFKENC